MQENITSLPRFSFFQAPVTVSKKPYTNINLNQVYKFISRPYSKRITEQLRLIHDKDDNRNFKMLNFHFVTFSGLFQKRGEKALLKHSGLMVLDFDHLEDVNTTRQLLLKDRFFETQLLFTSPNGNGLKWVIEIDITGQFKHGQWFDAVRNYIKSTYHLEVDKSGRDISRVCFLCYDPGCFLHPKYMINEDF